MDFSLSPRVKSIQGLIREFMETEVLPLEQGLLQRGFEALEPALERVRARARQTGLFAAHVPAQYGGGGLSLTEFAHMSEELGRSPLGHYLFNCQAPDVGNMEILMEHGTQAQQERFLLPLVRGEIRSCFTMTEPEFAGSNPVWMGTAATRDGDEWVIRGHKWFATGADGASFAICMAVTDPDAADRYRRASMLIVPTDTPGYELIGNLSIMGSRGGGWASHGEVAYHGARVPLDALLGGEGMGFVIAQERLGPGRIHHCMRWVGVCERAFEIMCRHAATRELAPGRPLGTKQIVQQWIAESRAEIHAARLMVLHAAWRIEHEGPSAAREEISLIKVTVARTLQRVLDRAVQTLGGLGMTDDTPLAFWWAHERAARIYDGADEVHLEVVAKRILRSFGMEVRSWASAGPASSAPSPLDGSGAVRSGEELDLEALGAWLGSRVPGLAGGPRVTQYSGGASNWTYRLEYPSHDLVLRRPPAGTKAKSAHDMGREHRIQAALRPVYPLVPEMIALCDDPGVLGAEFYVMRRVPGMVLRRNLPPGVTLDPSAARALCLAAVDALVTLHAVDPARAGLEGLGKGPGYPRRQIEGWSDRYLRARTWNVPGFRRVRRWLAANIPDDVATCVIHGDFRLDNLVLDPADPTRILAVLDWEMATLGDPLMDLGNSLAYWVEAGDDRIARSTRRQPTHLPGMLTRRELVDAYCSRSGRDRPPNWTFYEVYGLFRLAVIAQQIYYRYHHRQTRNPAFKRFWIAVRYLEWRCRRLIRKASG